MMCFHRLVHFLCTLLICSLHLSTVVLADEIVVKHLHLAFGDSADAMRVGFSTDAKEWLASSFSSICNYWPESDNHSVTSVESSFVRTYNASAWKSATPLRWGLRFVQLNSLTGGVRYSLQCGVRDVTSGRIHLSTNITYFDFETDSRQWSFVAFGDLGVEASDGAEGKFAVGYTRKRIEHEVVNRSARFVLHYGDISYARGKEEVWDEFMDSIEPVASVVPWMVCPGNHDVQVKDSGGESGVPFFGRFWMPSQCTGNPYWYSYNHGGIHFISLSTEHDYGVGSAQLEFLEADLKQAVGKQPFIVVTGHRPLLSSHMSFGRDHDAMSKGQWEVWQPIFEKYNVDMSLWGHIHAYERTMQGTMPIISSGMAGQSYCCGTWDFNPPNWSVYREDSHGYLRVNVNLDQSPASMHVEYVRSDDGRVHDAFTVFARDHATGYRTPLQDHMPERRHRSNLGLSRPLEHGIQNTCQHEEAGWSLAPKVPPGLCPAKSHTHELVV